MSRTDKIFNQILEADKAEIDEIKVRTKKIHHKLLDIQKRLIDYARKPCNNEFTQLEKNGRLYFDDAGYKIKMIDNRNDIDADAHLGNFVDCLSKNDFGMKEFFDKVNMSLKVLNDQSNKCLDSCVDYEWDKSDVELSSCMKKCLKNSRNEYEISFDKIEKKIGEVLAKL